MVAAQVSTVAITFRRLRRNRRHTLSLLVSVFLLCFDMLKFNYSILLLLNDVKQEALLLLSPTLLVKGSHFNFLQEEPEHAQNYGQHL